MAGFADGISFFASASWVLGSCCSSFFARRPRTGRQGKSFFFLTDRQDACMHCISFQRMLLLLLLLLVEFCYLNNEKRGQGEF